MTLQSDDKSNSAKAYSLETLEKAFGENKPFMNHMLQIFIRENSQAMVDIKKAYEVKDLAQIQSIAHRIKPSVNHLQMASVFSDLRTIEHWEGDFAELGDLINKVSAIITEVVEDLQRITAG